MGPLKRRYLVGGLAVLGAELAFFIVFVFSGLYNVSASREHLDLSTWILDLVRHSSVRTQSIGVEAPALGEPGLVALGAMHYRFGCAPCHGAPGEAASPIVEAMLPEPPSLTGASREWSPAELYWIVLNGQKYTGMPAWLSHEREDEVWPVVAFLDALPQMRAADYDVLTALPAPTGAAPFLEIEAARSCIGCHGMPNGPQLHPRVPRLGGQSEAYLRRSLTEFASGLRKSGTMQLFAAPLAPEEIEALARFYAGTPWSGAETAARPEPLGDELSGAAIFELGIPEQDVPACTSCHDGTSGRFPIIAGQSAGYLLQQLELWSDGLRDGSAPGQLMARIATRLNPEQRRDVAAYLGSLQPGGR